VKHWLPVIIGLLLIAGCEGELDTGYKPKKLGVSPEERRGYYAPQFSPEAEQALQGDKEKAALHKPTGY
jgi:hypothetical protein